jgi:non-specific serine/threonine protein kinase
MPYIEGETLKAKIAREGPLPVEDALRLAREIAGALSHAHHHGLIHRDVKPENVLLSDGIALVADFGIAHIVESDDATALTAAGTSLGTPSYMAPEQISGSEAIDGRADIYSLACVAYEMLTGKPPFSGPIHFLVHQHLSVQPRPLREVRPEVPEGVADAIAKALAKRPADRHETASRFAEALTADRALQPTGVAAAPGTPNNLPAERTRFIGREKELAECGGALEETRLLTLTGVGGCGKTRLALKLAEEELERYPDGVWFVDFAPLTDPGRVAETVATALGAKEVAGRALLDVLREHIRGKRLLLILDNCEHLLSETADLADALLRTGEGLRILATSREGLGIDGERLFALRSLAVPPQGAGGDTRAVGAVDAVKLFVDRAQTAFDGFALTEENTGAVAEICRRLDGIPLAIELAAARVRMLSPDQIRARLDDRFRLLTGAGRKALPRHQTLQATIQWSYDQLSAEEQRLFRLLSVFAGGWTLESAARVSGDGADELEVLDLLSRLVDKSLVLVDRERGGEPRYGVLETVRQYAQERLAETGEAPAARRRHFQEFRSLAERAYGERFVREEKWASALETEHDNLRSALDFARSSDDESYLELAGTLAWFWQARSHLLEGREHLTAALAGAASGEPRSARARALWGLANTMTWLGDAAAARPWMEEALRVWRQIGDLKEVGSALEGIGWAQIIGGEDEAALATFEECLALQRKEGDPVLINRAMVALAQVLVALHRVSEARPMASEIVAYSKAHDDRRSLHSGCHFLADCALIEGRCEESLGLYSDSLAHAQAIGDRLEMSFEVQGVAMSLAGLGDYENALLLAASAKAEWERIGVDLHIRFWDALLDRYLGAAREALGADVSERAWQEGNRLPFDTAVARALDVRRDARA